MKGFPFRRYCAVDLSTVLALGALIALAIGCAAVRPARKLPATARYPGPDRLAMVVVPEGFIGIDGNLAEWNEMPRVYWSSRWDRVFGEVAEGEHPDRATLRMARDDSALYVAVRVVDEEVVNPYEGAEMWRGDGLELFLDVRPAGAEGNTAGLGTRAYTPGCYQLLVSPVSPEGDQARWHCMQTDPGAPKVVDVASRILEDGYTLEIRIPFVQLNGAPASRFDRPIGVDAAIDDIRKMTETQLSPLVQYMWSGKFGSSTDATNFGRAVPIPLGAPWSSIVRYFAPRFIQEGQVRSFVARVVTSMDARVDTSALELAFRYAGGPFDRPAKQEDWEVPLDDSSPLPTGTDTARAWADSILGLRIVERGLRFTKLVGGRYYVTFRFQGLGETLVDTVRAYYFEGKRWNHMDIVERVPSGDALTEALSSSVYLRADRFHLFDEATAHVTAGARFRGEVSWALSEAAGSPEAEYQVRLDVSAAGPPEIPAWSGTSPFSRSEIPFAIPVDSLGEGTYLVRAMVIDPRGAAVNVWYPGEEGYKGYAPTIFLGVHRGREYVLPTTLDTAEVPLTRAVPVGDPDRGRFPNDDKLHSYARSIWDLHRYEGRIYTGCGDWYANQGPIDIWSFGPPPSPGDTLAFRKEFTVDEESVDLLLDLAGRLVVPGTDPRDPWDFGNLYIKEAGAWRKIRTIPNGLHTLGAAYLDGKLYVSTGTERGAALYESPDWGETWKRFSTDDTGEFMDGQYWEMAVVGDKLLVTTSHGAEYVYRFDGDRLTRLVIPLFPGLTRGRCLPHRLVPYKGGVLYTLRSWRAEEQPKPLFFLKDLEASAVLIEQFKDDHVQDILVRADTCYVLTSGPSGDTYDGAVYRSSDLSTWSQIAQFSTPALAFSFEELEGTFYLGLACSREEANSMSGRICRLTNP